MVCRNLDGVVRVETKGCPDICEGSLLKLREWNRWFLAIHAGAIVTIVPVVSVLLLSGIVGGVGWVGCVGIETVEFIGISTFRRIGRQKVLGIEVLVTQMVLVLVIVGRNGANHAGYRSGNWGHGVARFLNSVFKKGKALGRLYGYPVPNPTIFSDGTASVGESMMGVPPSCIEHRHPSVSNMMSDCPIASPIARFVRARSAPEKCFAKELRNRFCEPR